jgi:hypothetical protein
VQDVSIRDRKTGLSVTAKITFRSGDYKIHRASSLTIHAPAAGQSETQTARLQRHGVDTGRLSSFLGSLTHTSARSQQRAIANFAGTTTNQLRLRSRARHSWDNPLARVLTVSKRGVRRSPTMNLNYGVGLGRAKNGALVPVASFRGLPQAGRPATRGRRRSSPRHR